MKAQKGEKQKWWKNLSFAVTKHHNEVRSCTGQIRKKTMAILKWARSWSKIPNSLMSKSY